jgi:hypothetical protein
MVTRETTTSTTKAVVTIPRFESGVIFAGAAVSLAITIVLLQFGSIIGFSASAPLREGNLPNVASWGIIVSGLWLLWTQVLSSLAGGYIAGRLRTPMAGVKTHEVEVRDGMAGALTWAVSTVIVFIAISIAAAFGTLIEVQADDYVANEVMTNTQKNAIIIFAFIAGATSLASAVAAWWAATVGGEHRDKGTDFSKYISFRK